MMIKGEKTMRSKEGQTVLNTPEILKLLGEKTGFAQKDIKLVLDAMHELTVESLKNGTGIRVMHGVCFYPKYIPEREANDMVTMERIKVPARNGVKINLSKKFRNDIA